LFDDFQYVVQVILFAIVQTRQLFKALVHFARHRRIFDLLLGLLAVGHQLPDYGGDEEQLFVVVHVEGELENVDKVFGGQQCGAIGWNEGHIAKDFQTERADVKLIFADQGAEDREFAEMNE
jgi:hypothetical protein